MEIIILDGKSMTSVEETHKYLAGTLRLPAYYGGNLDALADCLSELGTSVYVILTNAGDMRSQLGAYAERLLMVFEAVSERPGAFCFTVKK